MAFRRSQFRYILFTSVSDLSVHTKDNNKVVLIVPTEAKQHTDNASLYSDKPSGHRVNLAAQGLKLPGHGKIATLGAPISGFQKPKPEQDIPQVAKNAVSEWYKALGYAVDIFVPVTKCLEGTKYFSQPLRFNGDSTLYEPEFWYYNSKNPNRVLADYYLNHMEIIHRISLGEAGVVVPQEFIAAYLAGVDAQQREARGEAISAWFSNNPSVYKGYSRINEAKEELAMSLRRGKNGKTADQPSPAPAGAQPMPPGETKAVPAGTDGPAGQPAAANSRQPAQATNGAMRRSRKQKPVKDDLYNNSDGEISDLDLSSQNGNPSGAQAPSSDPSVEASQPTPTSRRILPETKHPEPEGQLDATSATPLFDALPDNPPRSNSVPLTRDEHLERAPNLRHLPQPAPDQPRPQSAPTNLKQARLVSEMKGILEQLTQKIQGHSDAKAQDSDPSAEEGQSTANGTPQKTGSPRQEQIGTFSVSELGLDPAALAEADALAQRPDSAPAAAPKRPTSNPRGRHRDTQSLPTPYVIGAQQLLSSALDALLNQDAIQPLSPLQLPPEAEAEAPTLQLEQKTGAGRLPANGEAASSPGPQETHYYWPARDGGTAEVMPIHRGDTPVEETDESSPPALISPAVQEEQAATANGSVPGSPAEPASPALDQAEDVAQASSTLRPQSAGVTRRDRLQQFPDLSHLAPSDQHDPHVRPASEPSSLEQTRLLLEVNALLGQLQQKALSEPGPQAAKENEASGNGATEPAPSQAGAPEMTVAPSSPRSAPGRAATGLAPDKRSQSQADLHDLAFARAAAGMVHTLHQFPFGGALPAPENKSPEPALPGRKGRPPAIVLQRHKSFDSSSGPGQSAAPVALVEPAPDLAATGLAPGAVNLDDLPYTIETAIDPGQSNAAGGEARADQPHQQSPLAAGTPAGQLRFNGLSPVHASQTLAVPGIGGVPTSPLPAEFLLPSDLQLHDSLLPPTTPGHTGELSIAFVPTEGQLSPAATTHRWGIERPSRPASAALPGQESLASQPKPQLPPDVHPTLQPTPQGQRPAVEPAPASNENGAGPSSSGGLQVDTGATPSPTPDNDPRSPMFGSRRQRSSSELPPPSERRVSPGAGSQPHMPSRSAQTLAAALALANGVPIDPKQLGGLVVSAALPGQKTPPVQPPRSSEAVGDTGGLQRTTTHPLQPTGGGGAAKGAPSSTRRQPSPRRPGNNVDELDPHYETIYAKEERARRLKTAAAWFFGFILLATVIFPIMIGLAWLNSKRKEKIQRFNMKAGEGNKLLAYERGLTAELHETNRSTIAPVQIVPHPKEKGRELVYMEAAHADRIRFLRDRLSAECARKRGLWKPGDATTALKVQEVARVSKSLAASVKLSEDGEIQAAIRRPR